MLSGSALNIAAALALLYFVFWFLSMIWHRKTKNCQCGPDSEWDNAPIFPVCQRKCPEGEISDGRGECVSAQIPFTKLTLDQLGKGKI